jgi:hypothetical protein
MVAFGRNQFVNPIQLVEIGLSKQKLFGQDIWQLLKEKLCAASRQRNTFSQPISTVHTPIQAGSFFAKD